MSSNELNSRESSLAPEFAALKKRECLNSASSEYLAKEVRKDHIPDFSDWQPPAAIELAFARPEEDLRTSIGK